MYQILACWLVKSSCQKAECDSLSCRINRAQLRDWRCNMLQRNQNLFLGQLRPVRPQDAVTILHQTTGRLVSQQQAADRRGEASRETPGNQRRLSVLYPQQRHQQSLHSVRNFVLSIIRMKLQFFFMVEECQKDTTRAGTGGMDWSVKQDVKKEDRDTFLCI